MSPRKHDEKRKKDLMEGEARVLRFIQEYLERNNISRIEAAEKLKMPTTSFYEKINGVRVFTVQDLYDFCTAFNCTPNQMFGFENRDQKYNIKDELRNSYGEYKGTIFEVDVNSQREIDRAFYDRMFGYFQAWDSKYKTTRKEENESK